MRSLHGEAKQFHLHPLFEKMAAPYLTESLRQAISQSGSVQGLREIPETLRRLFVTAYDIAPEWHVRMQAAFQRHVENAVTVLRTCVLLDMKKARPARTLQCS